jgi:hypothetical protein
MLPLWPSLFAIPAAVSVQTLVDHHQITGATVEIIVIHGQEIADIDQGTFLANMVTVSDSSLTEGWGLCE